MKFKLSVLLFLLFFSVIAVPFPQRSAQDIKTQQNLINKINQSPRNPDYRFELAMEFAATGWIELGWDQLKLVPALEKNYQDIVFKKYSAILASDPQNWQAYFRLAFAYYFMDEKEKAIESFKKVLEIYPDHVWSMGLIALLYGEQKNHEECIAWTKKGLAINNDATALHFLLGQAYYETGNYFGVLGETLSVGRLKSIEAKYRPIPPIGIDP